MAIPAKGVPAKDIPVRKREGAETPVVEAPKKATRGKKAADKE